MMASSTSRERICQQKETLSKAGPPPKEYSSSMEEDQSVTDSKDDEDVCPLFMEGLPRDFSQNPQLAALASLLDEEDNEDTKKLKSTKDVHVTPQKGSGKVKSKNSRNRRRTAPYPQQQSGKQSKESKASMGEAQLFMKMWKL